MIALDAADADHVAVCRHQAAYADAVTRRAWSELDGLFLPDARVTVDTVTRPPIELTGGRGVGEFVAAAIERFEFFELVILNVVVVPRDAAAGDEDVLRARSFTCELRQERESGHWSNAFGVYHDDLHRAGGGLRYARRRYQSIARTGRAEIFPLPGSA